MKSKKFWVKFFSIALAFVLLSASAVCLLPLSNLQETNTDESDVYQDDLDVEGDPEGGTVDHDGDSSDDSGETGDSGEVSGYWCSYYESDSSLGISKTFTIDSETTSYIIENECDLAYLSYYVNSSTSNTLSGYTFTLNADLDMSSHHWVPIGGHDTTCSTASTSYYFAGEFDGNGHTISGLDTSYADTTSSTYNYMGLFGYVYGTSSSYVNIHDVNIKNSSICGYSYVGSLIGYARDSLSYTYIYDCGNTGDITGGNSNIGGIVGYNNNSTISSCYNSGEVTGSSYIGGVIGYSYSSADSNVPLHDCYNTSSVAGTSSYVGGIVGYLYPMDGSALMYNCYNVGSVTGTSYVGGIHGYSDSHCLTYNCFNLGVISGSSSVGGVVGCNANNKSPLLTASAVEFEENIVTAQSSVSSGKYYCYYGGECGEIGGIEGTDYSGIAEYLSDIEKLAKTESWYSDSSYWSSSYEWDFDSVWFLSPFYNGGYPVLISSMPEGSIYFDEDGEFWYFEDGYMPQSVYEDGQTAPSDVDASAASEAYTIRLSTSSWAQVEIFAGTEDDYAYVTIYSGSNVEVASAWFVVEPIVWIVAYGSDTPTSVTSAVTAKIVTAGYVYSNAGTSFSWAMSSVLGMSVETLESYLDLAFASVGDFEYDSFSGSLSQLAVTDNATTLSSKIAVSSVEEIDSLGGTYASTCTDFVAFLLSGGEYTSASDYTDNNYWTRDLAVTLDSSSTYCTEFDLDSYTSVVQLNNGVYVTKDGTLSNAKLSTLFGARLTMAI